MKKRNKAIQKARTGAPSGVMLSLILHGVFFFIAGLLMVFIWVEPQRETFIVPPDYKRPVMRITKPTIKIDKNPKPRASKRIVAHIRKRDMPDIQIPDLPGDGDDLLGGIDGGGNFLDLPELPPPTHYGSIDPAASTGTELVGVYYDMKYTRSGRYIGQPAGGVYRETFRNFINQGLNPSVMRQYYRAPNKLYMKCLVMGVEPSAMAPTAFGMPDDMCIGGSWIVHYRGKIVQNEDITFRFWGAADDTMAVFLDGEIVLAVALTESRHQSMFQNSYTRPGSMERGQYRWIGDGTDHGEWITLKAGVPRDIDIVITDNPPPKRTSNCAFILAVEEKGKRDEYEENYAGWPIFPIFKTVELSHDELDLIYQVTEDGMVNCTNGPVFNDFHKPGRI